MERLVSNFLRFVAGRDGERSSDIHINRVDCNADAQCFACDFFRDVLGDTAQIHHQKNSTAKKHYKSEASYGHSCLGLKLRFLVPESF